MNMDLRTISKKRYGCSYWIRWVLLKHLFLLDSLRCANHVADLFHLGILHMPISMFYFKVFMAAYYEITEMFLPAILLFSRENIDNRTMDLVQPSTSDSKPWGGRIKSIVDGIINIWRKL